MALHFDNLRGFTDSALRYSSEETKSRVLDLLWGALSDTGETLDKNTPDSDILWLAQRIAASNFAMDWGDLPEEDKRDYLDLAQRILWILPAYQLRVAERCISMAQVVGDMAKAQRKRLKEVARETEPAE